MWIQFTPLHSQPQFPPTQSVLMMLAMHPCAPMKRSRAQMEPKPNCQAQTSKASNHIPTSKTVPHVHANANVLTKCQARVITNHLHSHLVKSLSLKSLPAHLLHCPPTLELGNYRGPLLQPQANLPTLYYVILSIIKITEVVAQYASTLDTVVEIINSMPTQFAESHPHLSQDTTASQQCPLSPP